MTYRHRIAALAVRPSDEVHARQVGAPKRLAGLKAKHRCKLLERGIAAVVHKHLRDRQARLMAFQGAWMAYMLELSPIKPMTLRPLFASAAASAMPTAACMRCPNPPLTIVQKPSL